MQKTWQVSDSNEVQKTWQVYCFGEKKCLEVRFEGVQRGFLLERKGKVIPCRGSIARKGAGTNS